MRDDGRTRWGRALLLGAGALALLILARGILKPFLLGLLLAYVLTPPVSGLARRIPRWLAVVVVYVGLGGTVAVVATVFVPRLSADFARLFRESPRFFANLRQVWVPRADAWLEQNFPQETPEAEPEPRPERKLHIVPVADKPGELVVSLEGLELEVEAAGRGRWVIGPRSDSDEKRPRLADFMARAAAAGETEVKGVFLVGQRFFASLVRGFAWFILTFMVAAYVLVDHKRLLGFLRSLAPARRQTTYDELMVEIDRGLAGVIRGQLLICVVNGVLTTVGLLLLNVKYALLLGGLAGTMSFIPVFGSILSSVPIVVVALASGGEGVSFSTALLVLAWIVAIHLLEANFLNPRIIGTAARIHPLVVVFALLVGEEVAGLTGAVTAVPIASMAQSIFVVWRRVRAEEQAAASPAADPTPAA